MESTTEVTQIARRILDILELPEDVEIPDWLEELLEVQVVPHEYRGRYSYRQEQRTPDTPNRAKNQVGYRVPSSAWGIVVDRSGSINSMLKPLQQGLMAIHLALEELELPHRIAAFEGNVLLKDFGDTSPVPRAFIAGLQGATCSMVMPTLQPTFEALLARTEEVKVLLLLHDGAAHDPAELASWAREARCIPGFFFWGIYLGNDFQEEAAMRGLLGADRLIACPPGELHLKFGNVLRAFRAVGV